MKSYLFFETQAQYIKPSYSTHDGLPPDPRLSYLAKGWLPISRAIKDGAFLKLSAEREGVKVEARFNILKNVEHGDNGLYEIKRGPLVEKGIFRNICHEHNPDFNHFFLCHSDSPVRATMLRWQIGIDEFLDAATVSIED
jgi:hypothetical protein